VHRLRGRTAVNTTSTAGLSLGLAVGVLWLAGLLPSPVGAVLFGVTVGVGVAAGIVDQILH
jgi:hypothetical protein